MAISSSTYFAASSIGERDRLIRGRRIALLYAVFAITLSTARTAQAQEHPAADTIITNAYVWTVDRNQPHAEAVAILNQRIAAVGSSANMDAWRGPRTKIIDAGAKLLLPGFNDAHVHFVSGGFQLDNVQLKDAASLQEFARLIGERAKNAVKGEWILGGNWDETKWSPPTLPTKDAIDNVTANVP